MASLPLRTLRNARKSALGGLHYERLLRQDAANPSRTGISTRDACATLGQVTLSWPASRRAERLLNVYHECSRTFFEVRRRSFFTRINCPGQCPSERAGKIICWSR